MDLCILGGLDGCILECRLMQTLHLREWGRPQIGWSQNRRNRKCMQVSDCIWVQLPDCRTDAISWLHLHLFFTHCHTWKKNWAWKDFKIYKLLVTVGCANFSSLLAVPMCQCANVPMQQTDFLSEPLITNTSVLLCYLCYFDTWHCSCRWHNLSLICLPHTVLQCHIALLLVVVRYFSTLPLWLWLYVILPPYFNTWHYCCLWHNASLIWAAHR